MIVWKKTKSLITGKVTYYPKRIETDIMTIFNDFEWWKFYCSYHSEWIIKNRDTLPDIIKENVPKHRVFCIYEYDKRYGGHRHW